VVGLERVPGRQPVSRERGTSPVRSTTITNSGWWSR
jgi:hypothetical protein